MNKTRNLNLVLWSSIWTKINDLSIQSTIVWMRKCNLKINKMNNSLETKFKKEDSIINSQKKENVNTGLIQMKNIENLNFIKIQLDNNLSLFLEFYFLWFPNFTKRIFDFLDKQKNIYKYHVLWDKISMDMKFYYFSHIDLWLWSSSSNPFFPILNDWFKESSTSVLVIILFIVIVGFSSWSSSFSELFLLNIFLRCLGHLGSNIDSLLINWFGVGFSWRWDWSWLFGETE